MSLSVPAGQRKVQFSTLMQGPIRLYSDSRNLNSFMASAPRQRHEKTRAVSETACIISYWNDCWELGNRPPPPPQQLLRGGRKPVEGRGPEF
jgi:hypothetical protein